MEPEYTIEEVIEYKTKEDGTKVKVVKKIKKIKKKAEKKEGDEEKPSEKFFTSVTPQSTMTKEKEHGVEKFQTEQPKKTTNFGKKKAKGKKSEAELEEERKKKEEELKLKLQKCEEKKVEVENELAKIKGLILIEPNRYNIERVIGEGTFGIASRALFKKENESNEIVVIVKKFKQGIDDPHFNFSDFLREVSCQAELDIKGIPKLYGYNLQKEDIDKEKGDYTYCISLVLEPAQGDEVRDIIKEFHKRFTQPERCQILIQLCELVGELHKKGYVHRDLKPENLILKVLDDLDENGKRKFEISLLDFGCSKQLSVGDAMTVTTTQHRGTPNYAPPEAHEGDNKMKDGVVTAKEFRVTPAFDVWSVACIIQEFFTLKPPFHEYSNDLEGLKEYFHYRRTRTCEWGDRKRTFFIYDNNIQNNRMIFELCEQIFIYEHEARLPLDAIIEKLKEIQQSYVEKLAKKK